MSFIVKLSRDVKVTNESARFRQKIARYITFFFISKGPVDIDLKRINKLDMLDSWHYHYTWRPPHKGEKSCCVLRIRCVNLSLLIVRQIIDKEMDSQI